MDLDALLIATLIVLPAIALAAWVHLTVAHLDDEWSAIADAEPLDAGPASHPAGGPALSPARRRRS